MRIIMAQALMTAHCMMGRHASCHYSLVHVCGALHLMASSSSTRTECVCHCTQVEALAKLVQLQKLSVSEWKSFEGSLSQLSALTNLQHLAWGSGLEREEQEELISCMPAWANSLTHLALHDLDAPVAASLNCLTRLTRLRAFCLDLDAPLVLPALRSVHLGVGNPSSMALLQAPQLREWVPKGDDSADFTVYVESGDGEEAGELQAATSPPGVLSVCHELTIQPAEEDEVLSAMATGRLLAALQPWAAATRGRIRLERLECTGAALASLPPGLTHLEIR